MGQKYLFNHASFYVPSQESERSCIMCVKAFMYYVC